MLGARRRAAAPPGPAAVGCCPPDDHLPALCAEVGARARRARGGDPVRHTTTTLLLEQGVELVVIKELLATPTSVSPPPSTPISGSASSEMPSTPSARPSATAPEAPTATAADTAVSAAVAVAVKARRSPIVHNQQCTKFASATVFEERPGSDAPELRRQKPPIAYAEIRKIVASSATPCNLTDSDSAEN